MNRILTASIAVVLLAAGCGDDDEEPSATGDTAVTTTEAEPAPTDADEEAPTTTSTSSGSTTSTTPATSGGGEAGDADLALATTDLGDVLVDAGGMTLYAFTPDDRGDSTCLDECADRWPPVPELATVGEGLDEALLGTTTRPDGDVQATYGGWPLYRFAADQAAGDVTGQGVGDVWYVVDAAGEPVETAP